MSSSRSMRGTWKGGTTTNTKHYFFGGQRIAQKAGTGTLTYLHTDMHAMACPVRTTQLLAVDGDNFAAYQRAQGCCPLPETGFKAF